MTHDGILLFAILLALAAFVNREWSKQRFERRENKRRRHEEARRQHIKEYQRWHEEHNFGIPAQSWDDGGSSGDDSW